MPNPLPPDLLMLAEEDPDHSFLRAAALLVKQGHNPSIVAEHLIRGLVKANKMLLAEIERLHETANIRIIEVPPGTLEGFSGRAGAKPS